MVPPDPEPLIRRTPFVLLTSTLLVLVVALPAWAQPSFLGSTEVDPGAPVQAALRVPNTAGMGATTKVSVTVPGAFTLQSCSSSLGWSCSTAGSTATWTAEPLASADAAAFGLSLVAPAAPGSYRFPTTQRDADGGSVTWSGSNAPALTVVGEPAPEPEPEPDPEPDPGPSPTTDSGSGGGSGTSGGGSASGSSTPTGGATGGSSATSTGSTSTDPGASRSPAPSPTGSTSGSGSSAGSGSGASRGSAGPTRTTGVGRGSTLDVTEGQTLVGEDGLAAPDVAAPSVAQADGGTVASGDAGQVDDLAVGTTPAQDGDGGGTAQRVAGGLLLLAGGGALLLRRRMQAGTRSA